MYVGNMARDANHKDPSIQALHKSLVHRPKYYEKFLMIFYEST